MSSTIQIKKNAVNLRSAKSKKEELVFDSSLNNRSCRCLLFLADKDYIAFCKSSDANNVK